MQRMQRCERIDATEKGVLRLCCGGESQWSSDAFTGPPLSCPHASMLATVLKDAKIQAVESSLEEGIQIEIAHFRGEGSRAHRLSGCKPENTHVLNVLLDGRWKSRSKGLRSAPRHRLCFHAVNLQARPRLILQGPYELLQFYVPDQAIPKKDEDNSLVLPAASVADEAIAGLAQRILPAIEEQSQSAQAEVNETAKELVKHLLASYSSPRPGARPGREALSPAQVRRATSYMTQHLGRGVRLAEIAQECKMSLSHFARAFHRTVGVTPHRWLLQAQITYAKELLRSSTLTIESIAFHCGFKHRVPFSNAFRRMVGVTPGVWRANLARESSPDEGGSLKRKRNRS